MGALHRLLVNQWCCSASVCMAYTWTLMYIHSDCIIRYRLLNPDFDRFLPSHCHSCQWDPYWGWKRGNVWMFGLCQISLCHLYWLNGSGCESSTSSLDSFRDHPNLSKHFEVQLRTRTKKPGHQSQGITVTTVLSCKKHFSVFISGPSIANPRWAKMSGNMNEPHGAMISRYVAHASCSVYTHWHPWACKRCIHLQSSRLFRQAP